MDKNSTRWMLVECDYLHSTCWNIREQGDKVFNSPLAKASEVLPCNLIVRYGMLICIVHTERVAKCGDSIQELQRQLRRELLNQLRVNGVRLDHNTFPPSSQYLQLSGL